MQGPVLQQYVDYRRYLRSHFEWMKLKNRRWTYGVWARRLELQDTSSITKVINGQRVPGPGLVMKLSKYFQFNDLENHYFRELIALEKVGSDPKLQAAYLERIKKTHPHSALRVLDPESYSQSSRWYSVIIREMCRMKTFREDPEWIREQLYFQVSAEEVTSAIQTLLRWGLLERSAAGRLQATRERTRSSRDVEVEAIKVYHEQMLTHAKAGTRLFDVNSREYGATSFLMNSKNIQKAKELIRDFRAKFEELMEEPDGDSVYQLQVQLFPLTRTEKE